MQSSEEVGHGSEGAINSVSNGAGPGSDVQGGGTVGALICIESWVVTREMIKVLTGFHHWAARRIIGMTKICGAGGEWEYPLLKEAMESTGLHPIGVYIKSRQKTIAVRLAFRPVYALCTEAERIPGTSWLVQWWDQYAVNESEE